MAHDVPRAGPSDRSGDVRRALTGCRFTTASAVAVLDGDRLSGLVTIEALLAADEATTLDELMDAEPAVVHAGVDQERAVLHLVRSGGVSLAVVDESGAFLGWSHPS